MRNVSQPFADLIIADPPFNIGFEYDSYDDDKPVNDYLDWSRQWIAEAKRLLQPGGNLLVCMGDEHVSDIDVICRQSLSLTRMNWIIWHYNFGQSGTLDTRKRFTRSKTHILRYVRDSKPYFDAAAVAVQSDRQKLYNDRRADPRGKCPDDVFRYKRIAGTHTERVQGIKTQMPVELLRIWVNAMCKPNGTVFDPFPGSGASLVAAKLEKRKHLGVELSKDYTNAILKRLSNA
ncbi:MAG: site-specific DNA-methyltransferase [Anaerolineales bacterium]|nr:site-specific DNA-methyltransferase [Anaerolineales bacterium]